MGSRFLFPKVTHPLDLCFFTLSHQISAICFSLIISRGSLYPNVGRVYPSLGYESAALADLCHQLYGISRVILVTTADIYGEDAVAVWNWRAKDYNFHTVGRISLVPGGLSTDATNAALTNAINDIAGMTTNDTRKIPSLITQRLILFHPRSPLSLQRWMEEYGYYCPMIFPPFKIFLGWRKVFWAKSLIFSEIQ